MNACEAQFSLLEQLPQGAVERFRKQTSESAQHRTRLMAGAQQTQHETKSEAANLGIWPSHTGENSFWQSHLCCTFTLETLHTLWWFFNILENNLLKMRLRFGEFETKKRSKIHGR